MAETREEKRIHWVCGVNSGTKSGFFTSFVSLRRRIEEDLSHEVKVVKREVRIVTYTDWAEVP